MKNLYLQTGLALIVSCSPIAAIQAAPAYNSGIEKTFLVKVTAITPSKDAKVYGSYMLMSNQKSNDALINGENTPYEFSVEAVALSTNIMSDSPLKVEIFEKNGNRFMPVLSAIGRTVITVNDSAHAKYSYTK